MKVLFAFFLVSLVSYRQFIQFRQKEDKPISKTILLLICFTDIGLIINSVLTWETGWLRGIIATVVTCFVAFFAGVAFNIGIEKLRRR